MDIFQAHIASRQKQLLTHSFFRSLERRDSLNDVRSFVSSFTFWAMATQDLLRLNEERIEDSRLRNTARVLRAREMGRDRWFLADLLKIAGRHPELGTLYSHRYACARDATYALMSEVFRASSDCERLVLLLAIDAANRVLSGALASYFNWVGATTTLHYFLRPEHEHGASLSRDGVLAELEASLGTLRFPTEGIHAARQLVDRVFDAFTRMLDETETGPGTACSFGVMGRARVQALPPPDVEILGKYRIIRRLAVGGMSEVFLARMSGAMGFQKTVVLKTIRRDLLAAGNEFLNMFKQEARLGALLNHPNIAQVFDSGKSAGGYYLVIEYIDGMTIHTLRRHAAEQGMAVSDSLWARVASLVCEGLGFAHDVVDPSTGVPLRLVHRDISPDNILLSCGGALKITDFGIAQVAGEPEQAQARGIKGKFSYMSPEQKRGEPVDRRSDIFSLGVMLYELLCGALPPMGEQTRQSELPPALRRVLARALAFDRSKRYATCREMQEDLELFIASTNEPTSAHELGKLVTELSLQAAVSEFDHSAAETVPELRRGVHDHDVCPAGAA